MFYYVLQCFMMSSESRNDRRHRIGDRASADRLRDRDNAAGIGDNSAEIGYGTTGIVDIAANVIPCWTPSWMSTGVTLFLEEKFQRGTWLAWGRGGVRNPTKTLLAKPCSIFFKVTTKWNHYQMHRHQWFQFGKRTHIWQIYLSVPYLQKKIIYIIIIKNPPKFTWYAK